MLPHLHECHGGRNFHFFYEFVPAAQLFQLVLVVSVCGVCSLLSLVVYFLPRKMATSDYDLISGAVREEEYKKTPWFNDQRTFAWTQRRCIRAYQPQCDESQEDTLHALENVIALIVGDENAFRFGQYKQWEADFLRHLLGHTTFEEEHDFTEKCQMNYRLCADLNSTGVKIGKKLTALLRRGSPLQDMYPNGAVEMKLVFDCCGYYVNLAQQFRFGRQFAAFIQGNNKQRYFVEVELNNDWILGRDMLPWKIYIGCTQGHSTGIVQPIENARKLSKVELNCFGWMFHVTDQKFERSIQQNGLRRYKRDSLHFMYDNDGSYGYTRKGAGTTPPRH